MRHMTWHEPQPVDVPQALRAAFPDVHPFVLTMLARRGMTDVDAARRFLDPAAYTPTAPNALPNMAEAVARLERARAGGERVLVWGDFDVDGQTATALLVDGLRGLGIDVTYYIPQRGTEGHGVHVPRLETLLDGTVNVLLTCDTGIAAHDAVAFANSCGVDVIVTDHHQLPETLPDALANVNSQRVPDDHPLGTLPGVGVAYKLTEALYDSAGRAGETDAFLDLVALGIVADVVVQTGDARYLLQRGLDALRHTQRLGLQKLYEKAGLNVELLDEETIGFTIAPQMNAVGRLDDANAVVDFLTTDDETTAERLANRLKALNEQRKMDTTAVVERAEEEAEKDDARLVRDYAAVVIQHRGWAGGIVGLVANRLVEKYNKPAFVLSVDDDGQAHGSARSVPGCNITAAIQQVAHAHPGMIRGYGGHLMAAGLQLDADQVDSFRRAVSKAVRAQRGDLEAPPALHVDGVLPLADVTQEMVHELRRLGPFGPGNPRPVLATERLETVERRTVGKGNEHMRLKVKDEAGTEATIMWWRSEPDALPAGRFDAAYTVGTNEFRGERSVQLVLQDFRAVKEAPRSYAEREAIILADYRALPEGGQLGALITLPDNVLIWCEGQPGLQDVHTRGRVLYQRDDLHPAESLAILTAPPSTDVLQAVLNAVNPGQVYVFSLKPGTDALNAFLNVLSGVVKYVLNHDDGQTTRRRLAGALGHTEDTVRAGLDWLAARGHITVIHDDGDMVRLSRGGEKDSARQRTTTERLTSMLQESKGYRAHYTRADASGLLGRRIASTETDT